MLFFLGVAFLFHLASPESLKSKSVNVALETVLEFDNKNLASDVKIIDNVQKFLSKVRNVLDKSKARRRSNVNHLTFTEFLEQALGIVRNYTDDQLEELVALVDDEVRKYHYKGCKFHELLLNKDVRRYMSNSLDEMKEMPTKNLRGQIDVIINKLQHRNFTLSELDFLEYLNSLYQAESSDKLYNFLNGLSFYKSKTKRSNSDLLKVVRNGIRSIVFDHYSSLNHNVRKDLKMKVATFFIEYNADDNKIVNTTVLRFSTIFDIDKDIFKKPIERVQNKNEDKSNTPKMKSNSKTHKKHKKHHYISLYPENVATKKYKTKKSKNKTHHIHHKSKKHTTKQVYMERSIETRPRASDNNGKSDRIVTEDKPLEEVLTGHNKPLKEIFTENNAVINVESQSKNNSRKQRLKNTNKFRDDANNHPRFRGQDLTDIEIDNRKNNKDKQYKGISIESFESNELDGHYQLKKKKEELKRSVKRKSSNMRRLWTNIVDVTTDTGYIMHKINSLEKQIEDMKHRIETVAVSTITTRKHWLPIKQKPSTDHLSTSTTSLSRNKTKHIDIPFWSSKATLAYRTKKTTTTQAPLYVFDSSSNETKESTETTPSKVDSTKLFTTTTQKPTLKVQTTLKVETIETTTANATKQTIPHFRSNDNITLERFFEDDNNATKFNLISTEKEKLTVVERARQNINTTVALMKFNNETTTINTAEIIKQAPIEMKMEIHSNIDVERTNNTKNSLNEAKTNSTATEVPFSSTVVANSTNSSLITTSSNADVRHLSRRTLNFLSPPERNESYDIALYNYA